MLKTLADILKEISSIDDRGIFFIKNSNTENYVNYSQLYKMAKGILYNLQRMGVKEGSELIFQIKENEDFLGVFWACALGKIIPVPISIGNTDAHRLRLYKIFNILKSPFIITDEETGFRIIEYGQNNLENNTAEMAEKIVYISDVIQDEYDKEGNEIELDSSDIAMIQFSSGSTGDPKGVVITHENLVCNIISYNKRIKANSSDVSLSWLPLTHNMGLMLGHIANLMSGMNQCIIPTASFISNPDLWFNKVSEKRVTITYTPNFGFKSLLKLHSKKIKRGKIFDWDLSCIRYLLSGAEPISNKLLLDFYDEMERYNFNRGVIHGAYGLSEGTVCVSVHAPEDELTAIGIDRNSIRVGQELKYLDINSNRSSTFVDVGAPLECCETRICDDDDNILAENIIGHIQIRGKNITQGYYNNEEANKKLFHNDGWIDTGDMGFFINGRIVVAGRYKDVIFVNGVNYYANDIERVAEETGRVEGGTIIANGVYNEEKQEEEILLFLLNKLNIDEFASIADNIKKDIYKVMGIKISHVIPIDEIPKTGSGKVRRFKLSESYKDGKFKKIIEQLSMISGSRC